MSPSLTSCSPQTISTVQINRSTFGRQAYKVVYINQQPKSGSATSKKVTTFEITKFAIPDGMNTDIVDLDELCKNRLKGATTKPFKSVEDVSSIFNKKVLEMLSVKTANVVGTHVPITIERQTLISNIYMMMSLFVASLKITGIDVKIMPMLFGEGLGTSVDLAYKTALTLAAMKVVNKNNVSFQVVFPSIEANTAEIWAQVFHDPKSPNTSYGGSMKSGGTLESGLFSLNDQELLKLYDAISKNVGEFMTALA